MARLSFQEFFRRHRTLSRVLLASLLFHAVLAAGAACWVVSRAWHRPPAAVALRAAVPPPGLPPEEPGGRPGGPASSSALPPAPAVTEIPPSAAPLPAWTAAEPAPPGSLPGGRGGGVSGGGAGTGVGSGSGAGFSLFGAEAGAGGRIVVAVDLSSSMFMRDADAAARLMAGTARAVEGLGPQARFGLLAFKDGVLAWKPDLADATPENRRDARAWLERQAARGRNFSVRSGEGTRRVEGDGTRGDVMLRQAWALGPERIVVVTDGQWDIQLPSGEAHLVLLDAAALARLAGELGPGPRVDVFFFRTSRTRPGEEAAMRRLAADTGGNLVFLEGATLTRGEP
ncbi:MAG: hypothetical protein PW734_04505 [Verrucomicrobium sp.]|nr:hypothetical protein [Verrucomicrobium sp.]